MEKPHHIGFDKRGAAGREGTVEAYGGGQHDDTSSDTERGLKLHETPGNDCLHTGGLAVQPTINGGDRYPNLAPTSSARGHHGALTRLFFFKFRRVWRFASRIIQI